jgi:hypothetical protein
MQLLANCDDGLESHSKQLRWWSGLRRPAIISSSDEAAIYPFRNSCPITLMPGAIEE